MVAPGRNTPVERSLATRDLALTPDAGKIRHVHPPFDGTPDSAPAPAPPIAGIRGEI
jgi:hypothetical protein